MDSSDLKGKAISDITNVLKSVRKHAEQSVRIQEILQDAFDRLEERHTAECKEIRDAIEGFSGEIIGNTREMQEVEQQARQIAPTDAVTLIRGDAGTGKEHIARFIHRISPRSAGPFTVLNCDSIHDSRDASSFESELFGYERGSFTGATSRRLGKAEIAKGGTLFLDEIGSLPASAQTTLLHFLQEYSFSRQGSNIIQHADVRIIASTTKNLESLVEQKLFREDLFYRLAIFQIRLPNLVNRKTDILLLANHFISKMNLKYGKNIARLSTPAIDMLMSYHWPGNVRELENCIEHASLATTDVSINAFDLPPTLQTYASTGTKVIPEDETPLATLLENYEREILTEALRRNDGNLSAAGRALSVSPRMMHYKKAKFGI